MNLNTLSSFLILPVVFLTRGIDFTEATAQGDAAGVWLCFLAHEPLAGASNLFWLRVAFGATQALAFLAAFYIRHRIVAGKHSEASRKEILVQTPKSPLQTEEPEPKRMTVFEYDMEQWASAQKSNAIQLIILGVIHYKW